MSSTKRKLDEDSPEKLYSNKARSKPNTEGRVDPTYGQRSALPGLDAKSLAEGDDISYDEEDLQALAYLRAVRQEATAIPNLLVAPTNLNSNPTYQEEDTEDHEAYYEDGAYYTSDPVPYSRGEGATHQAPDSRVMYFDPILLRYETLREQLQQIPPKEVVQKLDADHPTSLGKLETKVVRWWRYNMRTTDPLSAQVASMDKGTVLSLLGLITGGTLLQKGAEVDIGVSRWVWALLARLPDRGELNSEEIGIVRALGKKAVLVGMGLVQQKEWDAGIGEFEAEYHDEDGASSYVNEDEIALEEAPSNQAENSPVTEATPAQIGPQMPAGIDGMKSSLHAESGGSSQEPTNTESLAAAKARILAKLQDRVENEVISNDPLHTEPLNEEPVEDTMELELETEYAEVVSPEEKAMWNTKATVDMIITIAGEMYGQRDLLEFRYVWADTL